MSAATIHSITAMADDSRKSTTVRAIDRCIRAYKRTYDEEYKRIGSGAASHHKGQTAFRITMPPLDGGTEAIKAYIGCIAAGITYQIFNGRDGSQLLYAAQVALSLAKVGNDERKA